MRHVILALIALVALGGLLPAIVAEPAAPVLKDKLADEPDQNENSVLTTPSIAAFANDSWTPSAFVAPLAEEATAVQRNMTRNNTTLENSTYAIYDFLKDNYTAPAATPNTETASAAGKNGKLAWSAGESIYQFLDNAWTPATEVETYEQSPFKQHQMN